MPLTAFWIQPPSPDGPLGFGVTALSLNDALFIIRALGYGEYLPDDLNSLKIRVGITFAELDHPHVVANMGPIVVRGMWYPFIAVGVPNWANAPPGTAPDAGTSGSDT
jgi:hypothetical protein